MPVTTLDPNTALIVIDLQKGILSFPLARPVGEVVANARTLAQAFRAKALPVVLVTVEGVAPGRTDQPRPNIPPSGDWADLAPELEAQPRDHRVVKRTWGAFTGTGLEAWLKDRGVTQVVVCGVATSAGVESTARHAHELGFNVTLATDATTDRSAEFHDHSVTRIFPRIGETGETADIIALLQGDRT